MTYWNEAAVERCECGYVAADADDTERHYDRGIHAARIAESSSSGSAS